MTTYNTYNCAKCNKEFKVSLSNDNRSLKKCKNRYCNLACANSHFAHTHELNKIQCKCSCCEKEFKRKKSQTKKSKNLFCSKSCAAIYNNAHKTHGTRRSKLEKYLEEQLTLLYPDLEMHFNRKDAINSELDIYIPSISLAFELNGIFHYEPIYGQKKLSSIQNNDGRKFQACLENEISLCIIDTSSQKYFKPNTSQKFIDIIVSVINLNSC